MADITEPSISCLQNHVAFGLKDTIVIITSRETFFKPWPEEVDTWMLEIWVYNLWTERWGKYSLPQGKTLSKPYYLHCVAIGSVMYMLGRLGKLWKLTRSSDGTFDINTLNQDNHSKVPSPRHGLCSWEYGDKMWIFVGNRLSCLTMVTAP